MPEAVFPVDQRQKVGIARALLSQAEYLILDEATSSVDLDSEREIWNCIDELAKSRTLVLISHPAFQRPERSPDLCPGTGTHIPSRDVIQS